MSGTIELVAVEERTIPMPTLSRSLQPGEHPFLYRGCHEGSVITAPTAAVTTIAKSAARRLDKELTIWIIQVAIYHPTENLFQEDHSQPEENSDSKINAVEDQGSSKVHLDI